MNPERTLGNTSFNLFNSSYLSPCTVKHVPIVYSTDSTKAFRATAALRDQCTSGQADRYAQCKASPASKEFLFRGTRIKQQQESGMAWTLVSICICHSPWYKACTRSLTFSGLLDHVPAPHSALKQLFWPVSLACDILWLSRKFKCVHQQACILFLQSNSKAFFKRHQKRPERNQSHLSNSNHPKSRLNPRTL